MLDNITQLHSELLNIIHSHLGDFPFTKFNDQAKFKEQCLQLATFQWSQDQSHQSIISEVKDKLTTLKLVEVLAKNELAQSEFKKVLVAATKALMTTYLINQVADIQDDIELTEDEAELLALKQQLASIYSWERQQILSKTDI